LWQLIYVKPGRSVCRGDAVALQTRFANQTSALAWSAPLRSVNATCPLGQWP
jgi:hypothetical protein